MSRLVYMKLGFCGLGAMGAPMASNLLAAGCNLAVWDRTPDRADALVAAGASRAKTPAEAAGHDRAVVLMLTDAAAAESVLFREDGVVAGLPRGGAVINMGTIGVDAVEEISAKLDAVGLHFVDAPVAGSTRLPRRETWT